MRKLSLPAAVAAALVFQCAHAAEFNYRGNLTDGDAPANGRYDLLITVYDSETGGSALNAPIVLADVAVRDGQFVAPIMLDDRLAQSGTRWLGMAVRESGSKAAFDPLPVRQKAVLSPESFCTGTWDTVGNSGNPVGSHLGNNDAAPLEIRATGGVGINTATPPAGKLAVASDLVFTKDAARAIYVDDQTADFAAGQSLTVRAGSPRLTAGSFANIGGDLVLQAGTGYNISIAHVDGGDVIIRSGANGNIANDGDNGGDIVLQTGAQNNTFVERMRIKDSGEVSVAVLGAAGATALCRNVDNQIATCSSSERYKDHIVAADYGLDTIAALRPVRFEWKQTHAPDLGLVAEEVAAVEPGLATKNDAGQIEGVKYDRLAAVLVKAMQQQQAEIEALRSEQARLLKLLSGLAADKATAATATTHEEPIAAALGQTP